MGLFDFVQDVVRKISAGGTASGATAIKRFYAERPSWRNYFAQAQGLDFLQRHMLGMHLSDTPPDAEVVSEFLHAHPQWRLVDEEVLLELARRVSRPPLKSVAYNYADGFQVLVLIGEKYKIVETNLLPICKEPDGPEFGTPEAKLWMLAWTLHQLATRFMREAQELSVSDNRRNSPTIFQKHADAMAAAEACLTVNPWFYTAYTLLPVLWVVDETAAVIAYGAAEHQVRRLHPGITGKAFEERVLARFRKWQADRDQRAADICDEGERVCNRLLKQGQSLSCPLHHDMAGKASDGIMQIRALRERLASLCSGPKKGPDSLQPAFECV